MASLIRGVQDLVVEDREVKSEAQTDGVRGRKFGLSDLGGSLVSLERLVCGLFASVTDSKLSQVAVVIALPTIEINIAL